MTTFGRRPGLRLASATFLISALAAVTLLLVIAGRASATDDGDGFPVLGPGETMTGIYVMGGTVAANARTVGYIDAQLNFPRRVADNARYRVEVHARDAATTASCPGIRQAAPGVLCIYEVFKDARLTLGAIYNPVKTGGSIDRDGAVLYGKVESASSDDGDSPFSTGGWAITGLKRPRER